MSGVRPAWSTTDATPLWRFLLHVDVILVRTQDMTEFLEGRELPEGEAFAETFMGPSRTPLDGTLEWANVGGRWHCLRDVAWQVVILAFAIPTGSSYPFG